MEKLWVDCLDRHSLTKILFIAVVGMGCQSTPDAMPTQQETLAQARQAMQSGDYRSAFAFYGKIGPEKLHSANDQHKDLSFAEKLEDYTRYGILQGDYTSAWRISLVFGKINFDSPDALYLRQLAAILQGSCPLGNIDALDTNLPPRQLLLHAYFYRNWRRYKKARAARKPIQSPRRKNFISSYGLWQEIGTEEIPYAKPLRGMGCRWLKSGELSRDEQSEKEWLLLNQYKARVFPAESDWLSAEFISLSLRMAELATKLELCEELKGDQDERAIDTKPCFFELWSLLPRIEKSTSDQVHRELAALEDGELVFLFNLWDLVNTRRLYGQEDEAERILRVKQKISLSMAKHEPARHGSGQPNHGSASKLGDSYPDRDLNRFFSYVDVFQLDANIRELALKYLLKGKFNVRHPDYLWLVQAELKWRQSQTIEALQALRQVFESSPSQEIENYARYMVESIYQEYFYDNTVAGAIGKNIPEFVLSDVLKGMILRSALTGQKVDYRRLQDTLKPSGRGTIFSKNIDNLLGSILERNITGIRDFFSDKNQKKIRRYDLQIILKLGLQWRQLKGQLPLRNKKQGDTPIDAIREGLVKLMQHRHLKELTLNTLRVFDPQKTLDISKGSDTLNNVLVVSETLDLRKATFPKNPYENEKVGRIRNRLYLLMPNEPYDRKWVFR